MSDISTKLGNQLRTLRQRKGLSQERLANNAGINVSFYGQIERGIKKPTIDTLEKLVDALGITFTDLFSFTSDTAIPKLNPVIDRIVFELNNRSPEEQEVIYTILRQLFIFKDKT